MAYDKTAAARENYARLREAGVPANEAKKLRHKGKEAIAAAIAAAEVKKLEKTPEKKEQKPSKGNPARRVTAEEGKLLDMLREAGIGPEEVRDMLEDRLEGWLKVWRGLAVVDTKTGTVKSPGAGVMVGKLERQLEIVRRVIR